MNTLDSKKYHHDRLMLVIRKLALLPSPSNIKRTLSDSKLAEIQKRIIATSTNDLDTAYWEPLLLFIEKHTLAQIRSFDNAITIVCQNTKPSKVPGVTQFLRAGSQPKDDRLWVGGLFEIFVKLRLLLKQTPRFSVQLDPTLPNGREPDLRVSMGGRTIYLESTVITESDDDKASWERNFGSGVKSFTSRRSPYRDAIRFYEKVYDKLAKGLDPRKSQMSESDPNVLLISFYSPRAPFSAMSFGVKWALDELLANQPKGRSHLNAASGGTDISLMASLNYAANNSPLNGLKSVSGCVHKLLRAPRRISGILLFNGCSLKASRLNYNATNACQMNHDEIARLEKVFRLVPSWAR